MFAPLGVAPDGAPPVFVGFVLPMSCIGGCDRRVELISTFSFGTVYDAEPRNVVSYGSTNRQFRGSGLSMFTTDAHVSMVERPVVVPAWRFSPCLVRAFSVTSTPCQKWVRAGP